MLKNHIIIFFILFLITSCTSLKNFNMLDMGKHRELIDNFEKTKTMQSAAQGDLCALCEAYFEDRNYYLFETCFAQYMKRFKNKRLADFPSAPAEAVTGPLYSMRALLMLDLQKFGAAEKDAGLALELLKSIEASSDYGYTVDRARFTIMANTSLAKAVLGRRKEAELIGARLAIKFDLLQEPTFKERRKEALARLYFTLGDFDRARQALEAETPMEDALIAFSKLLPTYYILLPAVTGTIDSDALEHRYLFYKQYMFSKIAYETGNREKAKQGFDSIIKAKDFEFFPGIYWKALLERGKISIAENRPEDAIELFTKAMSVVEKLRSSINEETSRIGFVGDKEELYGSAIDTAVSISSYDRALEFVERSKSRALVDLLAGRTLEPKGSEASYSAILEDLQKIEDISLNTDYRQHLATLHTRKIKIEQRRQQLRKNAPEVASLAVVSPLSAQQIQNLLTPNETLLEYYFSKDRLFAFVVSDNDIHAVKLSSKGLIDDIKAFRLQVSEFKTGNYSASAQNLYHRLIAPLEDKLHTKTLTIVPHGPLHYLPFCALHSGQNYLIERFNLRFLPNASVLRFLTPKGVPPAENLLVLGNPDLGNPDYDLPGADTEARILATLYPKSKVMLRNQASEAVLKRAGHLFRFIHLACHGEFSAKSPLNSGLLLSAGDGEDGRLTVGELYALHLNADMVSLSACETGLGDIVNGDDIIGLTRGFLFAGASSVVATLWQVADEPTTELMAAFYENLKTMDIITALRQAQLHILKKWKHPYIWAAFLLTGHSGKSPN